VQERKVVVSRFLTAKIFTPAEKKSPTERVSQFVDSRKQIALYPFSPDFSVKELLGGGKTIGGDKNKDPSADNKEKEKKKLKFQRVGLSCFDPKAKKQEGQEIILHPRRNRDGQQGDVANVGWMDERPTMNPKEYKEQVDYMMAVTGQGPQIVEAPVQRNKRTGEIKQKSLGRNIGQITGTVGRAAIRALGIVVDADGRMRCPPGVPAANQFTDEIGSNCFDFTPSIAHTLLAIAQRIGLDNLTKLATLNEAVPIAKNEDGQVVALPRETYAAARRGARSTSTLPYRLFPPAGPTPPAPAGPDGSEGLRATAVPIDRADYEKEFRRLLRQAYPDKSDAEIDELTAFQVERVRIQDAIDDEKRAALTAVESKLGLKEGSLSKASPDEVRAALFEYAKDHAKVDLTEYFDDLGDPTMTMNAHNAKIHYGAVFLALDKMSKNHRKEYLDLVDSVGGERALERLLLASADFDAATILAKADADLNDDERAFKKLLDKPDGVRLLEMVRRNNLRVKEYEAGYFIGIVNQFENNPKVAEQSIRFVRMVDWRAEHKNGSTDYGYDAMFVVSDRGTPSIEDFQQGIILNPIALLAQMRDEPEFPDEFTLFQAQGAGTEVAKLQKIASAVDRASVEREAREVLAGINDFKRVKQQMDVGENNPQFVMEKAAGTTARAQLIFHHEMIHGRQVTAVYNYLEKLRKSPAGKNLKDMDNSQLLDLAADLVIPRTSSPMGGLMMDGQIVNYADMLSDPKFLGGMIDDLPKIINDLFSRGTGGAYSQTNMWQAVALRHVLDGATEKERLTRYNALRGRIDALIMEGKENSPEYGGTLVALRIIEAAYGSVGHSMRGEAWEKVAQELRKTTAIALMELQAEIGAGVATGIIKRTPEIDMLLSPIGLGYEDMPSPEFYIPDLNTQEVNVPGLGSVEVQTREGVERQIDFLKDEARKFFGRRKRQASQVVSDARRPFDGLRSESRDAALMSDALVETVALRTRAEVSRWGRSIAERVIDAATTRQKQVLSGKWQSARWNSADSGDWRNMLVLTPDQLIDAVESQFIPFTELIDSSVLPEGVAAEILLPNEIFDDDMGDISGTRFAIDNHFVGVVKSDTDLGVADGAASTTTRRMIITVPEGFKGLPDKTPGTEGGEFGGLILPPGEIEIIGTRSDGTLIARVVSQRSAEQHLNDVRQKLHSLETQQYRPLRERIAARRAVHKIDQGQRSRPAARAAAAVAMEMDPKNSKLASKIEYDPQDRRLTVTFRDGKKVDFDDVGYGKVRDAGAKDDPDGLIEELRSRGTMAERGARSSSNVADSVISAGEDEDMGRAWREALGIPFQPPPPTMRPKTIQEAVKYALQGYAVDMPNIEGAHILLDEFAGIVSTVEQLYKDGEITKEELKNFVFDLCNIHVANTSVFCDDNQGIPRYMMPQAVGEVEVPESGEEGKLAYRLLQEKKNKKATKMRELGFSEEEIAEAVEKITEVDLTDQFREWLKGQGYTIGEPELADSSKLKASQRDMQGQKIVGMFNAEDLDGEELEQVKKQLGEAKEKVAKLEDKIRDLVRKGDLDGAKALRQELKAAEDVADKIGRRLWKPNKDAIFVSRDGYVIDGHHRWAATLGKEFRGGSQGTHQMPVERVDLPILRILQLANQFTEEVGIKKKTVATNDPEKAKAYGEKIMGLVASRRADRDLVEAGKKAAEARFNAFMEKRIKDVEATPIGQRPVRPKKVVNTVEEGVEALLNGYDVDMPSVEGSAMFMQEIGEMVASLREMNDAAAAMRKKLKDEGKTDAEIEKILEVTDGVVSKAQFKRFVFDLCQVTQIGASAFCLGNKGIPRNAMPQTSGRPVPGSQAQKKFDAQVAELESKVQQLKEAGAPRSEIEKAEKKLAKFLNDQEVDVSDEFVEYLRRRGYKLKTTADGKTVQKVPTSTLKSTQGEMKGEQVAGMFDSYKKGLDKVEELTRQGASQEAIDEARDKMFDPSKKPIFVTSDGYVIDGHHRFGAVAAADGLDGVLDNNHHMSATVIDGNISEILPLAIIFAKEFGIADKGVDAMQEIDEAKTKEYMRTITEKINRHNNVVRGHDAVSMQQELRDDGPKPILQRTALNRKLPPYAMSRTIPQKETVISDIKTPRNKQNIEQREVRLSFNDSKGRKVTARVVSTIDYTNPDVPPKKDVSIWIADESGKNIGALFAKKGYADPAGLNDPNDMTISDVTVDEDRQRSGLATEMMELASKYNVDGEEVKHSRHLSPLGKLFAEGVERKRNKNKKKNERGARSMSSSRGEYPDDTTFKITDMPPDVKEFLRERRERAKRLSDSMNMDKPSTRVAMLERLENGYQISAYERDLLIDEMTRIEENWIRAGGIDMPRNQTVSAQERASAARLNAMLNRGNPNFRPAKGIDLRDIDVDHDSEFGPNAFWLPNIDGHAKNGRLHDSTGNVIGKYNVPRGKEGLIEAAEGGYYFDARGNIVGTYEYFDTPISVASYGNTVRQQQTQDESVTIGRRLARRLFGKPEPESRRAPQPRRRPKRSDLYK